MSFWIESPDQLGEKVSDGLDDLLHALHRPTVMRFLVTKSLVRTAQAMTFLVVLLNDAPTRRTYMALRWSDFSDQVHERLVGR